MPGFSNSLANAIVNTTLRGQAFPTIRTPYFALFTTDPTDAFTGGAEVSAAWYVRIPVGACAAPVNGVTYNSTRASFLPVTGANVTVTHIGVVEGANPTDVTSTLMYVFRLEDGSGNALPKTLTLNDVYAVETDTGTGDFRLTLV
jgi:hypothetical protein